MFYNNYNPYYPQSPLNNQAYRPQPIQQSNRIQSDGFILVPNEEVINSYPVGPGTCVTFKIEGKPMVVEKSMGFSQLEAPKIEYYRLVKEEPNLAVEELKESKPIDTSDFVKKSEFESIKSLIDDINKEIEEIRKGV